MKNLSCVIGTIAGILLTASIATADGLLFVSETKQQARLARTLVNVKIYDQIALTTVTHEFITPVKTDSLEVVYMFPLPENAAVTDFAIWRDQQFVSFKLVAADTGGGHQNLPGENLDPALQNYLLPNPFIFPTVAKEDTFRVRLSYAALLPYDFGAIKYRFPLYSSQFSAGPLDALAMLVTFSTQRTITGMQTPNYAAGIEQRGPYAATVGYDNANFTPPKDFVIDYTLSQKEVGLFTLTYHDPADTTETAGYFVLLLEPGEVQPSSVLNKYFTFVLDRSGSMLGVKMEQAKAAARFCVEHLNPNDFFNIVDFASDIHVYQNEPVTATAANVSQAVSYINNIQANGGTNANEALLTGLVQTIPGGVNQVVFLTDGLPTVGETNTSRILANVRAANKNNASIFVFGVGDYIGQDLLQALADENHGTATYLKENEPISDIIANFFARISNPVLVDVKLEFDDMQVFDLYPVNLSDIFAGFQQVIAGRNQTFGTANITLKGRVATADTSIVYSNLVFPAQSMDNAFVPKIWAKKKIDFLYARWLKENKPEALKQQIVALSVKYGVLSPFTQFKPPDQTTPVAEGVQATQLQAVAVFVSDLPTIRLTWHLEGEVAEIAAIEIYRAGRLSENYERIGTLPPNAVTFDDVTATPASNWYYRLDIIMRNGQRISTSISYQAQVIQFFHLTQNYPNPFNPKTRLAFYLGQRSAVELTVYNIRGEQVKILTKEILPAGQHQAEWDGTDAQGRPVASGIYFYRLRTPEFTGVRTMVLTK